MSDLDTQTRLARLKECFPTVEALAQWLDVAETTIHRTVDEEDEYTPDSDTCEKIRRAHEQIQKEHSAGIDAVSYALQTIERIREGTMTDEKLDNVERVLQQKADDLNTAYA